MGVLFEFVKGTENLKSELQGTGRGQMQCLIKNFIDKDVFQLNLYLDHLFKNGGS